MSTTTNKIWKTLPRFTGSGGNWIELNSSFGIFISEISYMRVKLNKQISDLLKTYLAYLACLAC